jgi:hypothetical protein
VGVTTFQARHRMRIKIGLGKEPANGFMTVNGIHPGT